MIAAVVEAFQLVISGDPALWDVILRSLWISTTATILAMVVAIPLAVLLGTVAFPGRWVVNTVVGSFQAMPAVVVGLLIYLLLTRQGPLGDLRLLFTSWAILIAQFVLVLPMAVALGDRARSPRKEPRTRRWRRRPSTHSAHLWRISWACLAWRLKMDRSVPRAQIP